MRLDTMASGRPESRVPGTRKVNWIAEHFPDPAQQREYARQKCVEAVGSALERAMESANLNRAALANKLGKSKGQVSRILGGAHNMTLHTLGELLWACDVEVDDLVLHPLGVIEVSTEDERWASVSGPSNSDASGWAPLSLALV
jgi:antitoxin component HigA of HigAB toxin-antitoxin module